MKLLAPMVRMILAAAAAAATLNAVAQQLPTQVYGFEIGKPLGLPTCEAFPGGALATRSPCVRPSERLPRQGFLIFPLNDKPAHLGGDTATYWLDDAGNLTLLVIGTSGPSSQDRVFQDLVAKFGKPDHQSTTPLPNAFGTIFESIDAVWVSSTLMVRFVGALSASSGTIAIGTPSGMAARDAALQRLRNGGRQL